MSLTVELGGVGRGVGWRVGRGVGRGTEARSLRPTVVTVLLNAVNDGKQSIEGEQVGGENSLKRERVLQTTTWWVEKTPSNGNAFCKQHQSGKRNA